ncbi:hypothetical protein TSUD_166180 [Trifolium subterraneum]|uniref:Aminotransferase-like plant mobile domain-containing protein n=1 Tax=Trifolium subterraneum TaxID=3900 RepID=A0A2Z6MU87_TRISU|nr:hypothetical protein TSUD_166180 [Trifolium subterraneum]
MRRLHWLKIWKSFSNLQPELGYKGGATVVKAEQTTAYRGYIRKGVKPNEEAQPDPDEFLEGPSDKSVLSLYRGHSVWLLYEGHERLVLQCVNNDKKLNSVELIEADLADAGWEVTTTKWADAQFTYLKPRFRANLAATRQAEADIDEVNMHLYQKYTIRVYLLFMVVRDLEIVDSYAWGTIAFAYLYRKLNIATIPRTLFGSL